MRDQEIIGLMKAYQQVCEAETARGPRLIDAYDKPPYSDDAAAAKNPVKMKRKGPKMKSVVSKEEVEIAAQYFYEMGLNEDGVNILIEELGVEEFGEFVYEIAEEYTLTEATRLQSGGAKLKGPKGSKPQSVTARREKKQGGTIMKADAAPASTISPKKVAAAKKAKEKQPERKGILGRISQEVEKGMARHRAAMSAARETGKTIRKAAGHIGGVAREVGKGATGAAKFAGAVAKEVTKEEVEEWVNALIEEGYDLSEYTWDDMVEFYLDEGMTMKDFKQQRSRQKQKEKRAAEKTSPTRRANMSSYERAVRHRVSVDPDYDRDHEERDYPGGVTKNPKKIRKAKALGELGEGFKSLNELNINIGGGAPGPRGGAGVGPGWLLKKLSTGSGVGSDNLRLANPPGPAGGPGFGPRNVRINPPGPRGGVGVGPEGKKLRVNLPGPRGGRGAGFRFEETETDLFDVILEYLIVEGYADTNKAALAIMANMSEEWRESIMEGMSMKDFKANRRNIKRREASADAKSRGHVSKNIVTHGRTYSPDEAKRNRANLSDYERAQRKSFNINPDQVGDTRETADKTKNPKKLRKQKVMGEH